MVFEKNASESEQNKLKVEDFQFERNNCLKGELQSAERRKGFQKTEWFLKRKRAKASKTNWKLKTFNLRGAAPQLWEKSVYRFYDKRRRRRRFGGDSEKDTPVPIPNTEVKLLSAENTWRATAREHRTLPEQRAYGFSRKLGRKPFEHLEIKFLFNQLKFLYIFKIYA